MLMLRSHFKVFSFMVNDVSTIKGIFGSHSNRAWLVSDSQAHMGQVEGMQTLPCLVDCIYLT
jgi:hypothetical protein